MQSIIYFDVGLQCHVLMLKQTQIKPNTMTEEKLTILSSSGPLTEMKFKPDSLATACNEREREREREREET